MLIVGIGKKDLKITKKHPHYKIYEAWHSMLKRCYAATSIELNPTYSETFVCDSWLTFSNFYNWSLSQDWEGKELDKDLLGDGKTYSPENCCFISGELNKALRVPKTQGKILSTGVRVRKNSPNKFCAEIKIGRDKSLHLGYYDTEQEASLAYRKQKYLVLIQLASIETDKRILPKIDEKYKV